MAQDYNVRFSGDTEQLKKALLDVKDRFERTSASVKPLRQKLSELRKQMELIATTELSQTTDGQELYNKLREAAQQYDKTLRQIQNDSRAAATATAEIEQPAQSLSQKVSEIKKKMEELVATGKINSTEGQQMWKSLAAEAKGYQDAVDDINKAVKNGGKNFNLKEIGKDLSGKIGLSGVFDSVAGAAAGPVGAAMAVGGTMIAAGKATAEFETHLNSLQALTGLTDKEMKAINDGAIEMSKQFKSSAGDIVDAMKLIGSQAPELLGDADALMEVTKAANVLSEAAEIDVATSASAITTVMNQMGVSASSAGDIINTFAAASQKGSAGVDELITAFEKSGTAASMAGMNYTELTAAIEAARIKFGNAATEGTSLMNFFFALEKQSDNNLKPSVVGLSKVLDNLSEKSLSTEEALKMFGQSGMTAAMALIEQKDTFNELHKEIQGTNTAYEQMAINQKGIIGMINKLKGAWDAFLLALGQSGVMEGLVDNIMLVVNAVTEIINVVSDVIKSFDIFSEEGVDAINPIQYQLEAVVNGVKMMGKAIQVVVRIIGKCFNAVVDTVKSAKEGAEYHWNNLKKSLKDITFLRVLVNAFNKVIDAAANMVAQIKGYWNSLKKFLGMSVDEKKPQDNKPKHTDPKVVESLAASAKDTGSSAKKTKKTKSEKAEKTEKIDYLVSVDDATLETAEKKLSAWQSKQKTIKIDDVEGLKECSDQIKKWQDEVKKRKMIIEFGYDVSENLAGLKAQLKEVENLKSMMIDAAAESEDAQNELTEFLNEVNSLNNSTLNVDLEISSSPEKLEQEINHLRQKIYRETVKLGLKPEIEAGSLNDIKAKIKAKEEEINILLNTDIDPESMKRLQKELDELRKQEKEKSIEIGVTKNVPTISKNADYWERGSVEDKKQSLSNAQTMVKEIQENYKLKLIGKDEVQSQLSEINTQLESLGLKPIELKFNEDGTLTTASEDLERYKNEMASVSEMASSMGNVFGSLGGAIGGTTGEVMKFAGQSINAIAQIIPQIVTLITAKQAEAIAAGSASAMGAGFPACIPALATILATIASVFASLPKFESGGIVGGTSYTGDKLLARVNSGELILNKRQQQNLYNSMSNAEIGQPVQNTLKGDVNFTITGSALKGTLKNYDSKMSKIK